MIFVEEPLLISMSEREPVLMERIREICESQEESPELPHVWHYAGLLSLLDENSSIASRMGTKWIPSADNGSRVPRKIVSDCENVLAGLVNSDSLPEEMRSRLSGIDVEQYGLLTLVWRYNSFGHHTDASALCMYDITSMMAHSCGSSGVWHFGGSDSFCLRARVGLRPGDEITISYLGDEDLFKSIPVRREKTNGWLFFCSCDRCCTDLPDFSRAFRCPVCVVGSVFVLASDQASACDTCGSLMSAETLERYFSLEKLYEDRIGWIDKTDFKDIKEVLKEALNLFSLNHHWIVYTLETMLGQDTSLGVHERILLMHRRLTYLTRCFPMANYTTAWLLEELGEAYASISGGWNTAVSFFERAYWTLRILCGADHPFCEAAQVKWDEAVVRITAEI